METAGIIVVLLLSFLTFFYVGTQYGKVEAWKIASPAIQDYHDRLCKKNDEVNSLKLRLGEGPWHHNSNLFDANVNTNLSVGFITAVKK